MASERTNARKPGGARLEANARIPNVNAMSVGIAMPQPRAPSPPALIAR